MPNILATVYVNDTDYTLFLSKKQEILSRMRETIKAEIAELRPDNTGEEQ